MAPPPLGSRQSNRSLVFGLGASITDSDAIITGAKLPSGRQILRCMMYNCVTQLHAKRPGLTGAMSRFQAAKAVLEQVRPFYGKANIPMVSDRRACDKMVALLDASNKLRHIPKARRSSKATARLVDAMEHKLDATFPLWSPNAEELIRDPEDIAFLASMKGDRVATFGAFDAKLQSKLKRRQEREAAQQAYLTKEQQEMTATSSMAVLESESDEDGNADETAAPSAENTPTREPSRSLMSSSEEVVGAMPERSMAREMGVAAEPGRDLIGLSSDPLSIERVYSSAVSPSCGAVALFVGTTREHFEGRRVIRLEYEAYEAMVQSELSAVCREIRARWPMVKHICIQHRLGLVPVAEASVAIAISTPHRSEAQEAVGYCINALKASAPIWKKEVYESEDPEWKENPECGWSKNGGRGRSELEAP